MFENYIKYFRIDLVSYFKRIGLSDPEFGMTYSDIFSIFNIKN
jgi:hypothetical protein